MSTTPSSSTMCTKVFENGKFEVKLQSIDIGVCTRSCTLSNPPPKSLLVCIPVEAGEFPILIILHGYLLYNSFYSQLIRHIASHGFIVVAPQLYNVAGPDATEETKSAAAVTYWLHSGLEEVVPSYVRPNMGKIALAGHSRGGKVAFALALKEASTDLKYAVVIGIDPVDGKDVGKQTPPPVLTYVPGSFELDCPVMVIGSGLGEVRKSALLPPCAPKGVSHEEFFRECRAPACYFVVKDYGHTDMLDDDTSGIRGMASYCVCKNGKSRAPMRTFVGGAIVAFMKAYVLGDHDDLNAIYCGQTGPVHLQAVEFSFH